MAHLPDLIKDLGLILLAAGIITILFKWMKQPVVLGYIIAGILVSPNFPIFPTVTDTENIHIWSEIGVIMLLFSLGLEFSFKKLAKVGGSSSVTALTQIVFMIGVGYTAGHLMGWSTIDSIFLGAILSMSSTTIILRAFDELNVKHMKFAGIVFGALIIEDLLAIVIMVLLSTLAVSQEFAGMEMIASISKLVFYLILWFLGGIFIIPTFLAKTKRFMNDETLLVVSLALCFTMVFLAYKAGFSAALGAFIMGSILAETTSAEKIEHLIVPIKDLFGAVFFVSVGMLIDLNMMVEYAWPILIVTIITILGKTIFTTLGAVLSGQPLKQSVQAGMSLAQIGEFSFIIASLGVSLKVTSSFLYPIVVAVSGITTFTTPFMIKSSDRVYNALVRFLPNSWLEAISNYSSGAQMISGESNWKAYLKAYLRIVVINGVILASILLTLTQFVVPRLFPEIDWFWGPVLTVAIALIVASPFLYILVFRHVNKAIRVKLWANKLNRGPMIAMHIFRYVMAVFFIGALVSVAYARPLIMLLMVVLITIILYLFRHRMTRFTNYLQSRFVGNLNAREIEADKKSYAKELTPWDAHVIYMTVHPNSAIVGKTLQELEWRQKYGVNITSIKRGEKVVFIPKSSAMIFPGDQLSIIGEDEQVEVLRSLVEAPHVSQDKEVSNQQEVALIPVLVDEQFDCLGKSILESGIREKYQAMIVGIERDGERNLNPLSSTVFKLGDVVWMAGNKEKIRELDLNEMSPV